MTGQSATVKRLYCWHGSWYAVAASRDQAWDRIVQEVRARYKTEPGDWIRAMSRRADQDSVEHQDPSEYLCAVPMKHHVEVDFEMVHSTVGGNPHVEFDINKDGLLPNPVYRMQAHRLVSAVEDGWVGVSRFAR